MIDVLLYIFAIVIGIVIGAIVVAQHYRDGAKVIGSLVIIDDPADNAPSVFMEIDKGNIDMMKVNSVVKLKIVKRTLRPHK